MAVSRSCPPPSPPATSGCPGCALGWRRAGESGRVFPPPLGQASERAPPSASLPRQSGSGARPPAFSRRLPPGGSGPARSLGWIGALEGGFKSARVNCRAREVRSGASMVSGARQGPGWTRGWGQPPGLSFPATLAKPQPLANRVSVREVGWGARVRRAPRCPLIRQPRHGVAGLGTDLHAPLEGPAAGYAPLCNPCKRAFPEAALETTLRG